MTRRNGVVRLRKKSLKVKSDSPDSAGARAVYPLPRPALAHGQCQTSHFTRQLTPPPCWYRRFPGRHPDVFGRSDRSDRSSRLVYRATGFYRPGRRILGGFGHWSGVPAAPGGSSGTGARLVSFIIALLVAVIAVTVALVVAVVAVTVVAASVMMAVIVPLIMSVMLVLVLMVFVFALVMAFASTVRMALIVAVLLVPIVVAPVGVLFFLGAGAGNHQQGKQQGERRFLFHKIKSSLKVTDAKGWI